MEEARKSLAWALQVSPESLPLPAGAPAKAPQASWFELFTYPRSLLVSWLGNAGAQTGAYGVALWAPALFVLLLKVPPQQAAKMMILLSVTGFIGRLSFAWLSERIGRRNCGGLLGFGGGLLIITAGYNYDATLFGLSAFWLILAAAMFFVDGGFAIVGPYAAEVWPSHLKTTGMGSAYGFGGIGKIIGLAGLARSSARALYWSPPCQSPDGLPLSRLLVPDGRWSVFLSGSRRGGVVRRSTANWPRPTEPPGGCLGHVICLPPIWPAISP
jgi:putative MFS transporter